VALSSTTAAPSSIVSTLAELDIHLPADRNGLVVDHFNYDVSEASEKHDVLLLPPPGALRPDVKDFFSPDAPNGELLAFPSGMGQTLGSGALLAPILRAPSTAYGYNPKEQSEVVDDLFASGKQLSLVTTVQARNSGRLTVVGSADMLTDKWFDAKVKKVGEKSSVSTLNREFAKRVSGWTFHELGVLKVNWIEHHLNEPGQSNLSNPKIYRIKNDVVCSISSTVT
jgi:oligosaccharyltransferase complex subunit beta